MGYLYERVEHFANVPISLFIKIISYYSFLKFKGI